MQYIPLADLLNFLGKPAEPLSHAEQREAIAELEEAYASGKHLYSGGKTIGIDDAKAFIRVLDHMGVVVFDQWIMQSKGLSSLLVAGNLHKNDFDQRIVREHRLFHDFSKFVTPFLLPALVRKIQHASDRDLMLVAGYIDLLDAEGRLIVQDKLDAWLREKLSQAHAAAKSAATEQELADAVRFVISDEVIALVNHFHKSFYATKIAYIDQMLEVIRMRACTQRLGGRISGQLQKLELNPEHIDKLREITGTVRQGKVPFINQSGRISVGFGSVGTAAIVIGFLFLVIFYFTWFPPFASDMKKQQPADQETSFGQFTKQERMQMDSLIRTMTKKQEETEDYYGEGKYLHLPPADMNVVYRDPYRNIAAEQFHQDCIKDELLMGSGQADSCEAYSKARSANEGYPNFRKLADNKGSQEMFLQNETAYQVLVVVFANAAHAPVYSALVSEGDKLSFRMDPGQVILFLPGNDWAPFRTSASTDLPSGNYKHHFCLQDENFKSMLFSPYRLKPAHLKLVKLMLNESPQNGTDFFLIDLYEALENLD